MELDKRYAQAEVVEELRRLSAESRKAVLQIRELTEEIAKAMNEPANGS